MIRLLYLLFTLICLTITSDAAADQYVNRFLDSSDGLSNGGVSYVYRASDGMMWFSTWDGLNCYDGDQIKVYKSDLSDNNTLADNICNAIIGQSDGTLWVESRTALNHLDPKSGHVDRYLSEYVDQTHIDATKIKAAATSDGRLFALVIERGLFTYDPDSDCFTALQIPGGKFPHFIDIVSDGNDQVWLKDVNGHLFLLHENQNGISFVPMLTQYEFKNIYAECNDELWLVDSSNRLFRYMISENNLSYVLDVEMNSKGDIIRDIERIGSDYYIATAKGGLKKYAFKVQGVVSETIIAQDCLSLFYDEVQQILWIGHNGSGVILRYADDAKFSQLKLKDYLPSSSGMTVRALLTDADGNLYIGTRGNGILAVRRSDCSLKNIYLPNKSVMSFCNHGGQVFIGTEFEGIFTIVFPSDKRPVPLKFKNPEDRKLYSRISAYSMYCSEDGRELWVGTMGQGLLQFFITPCQEGGYTVTETICYNSLQEIPRKLSNDTVYSVCPSDDGTIWVATRGGGVHVIDPSTRNVVSVITDELGLDDVLCLYPDPDSSWWAGTSYGLVQIDQDSAGASILEHFTEKDGLPNNTIHGIVGDSDGNLWLSTNKGLSCFTPATSTFINYGLEDNIHSFEFNDCAYHSDSSGTIYFGGVDGVTYFNPSQITDRNYRVPLLITDLWVNNYGESVFGRFDPEKKTIVLKADENFFNVRFVSLDYLHNSSCLYKYKLEGFNEDWVYNGTSNVAHFTNVPSGSYTLSVCATNGDKVWSSQQEDIRIVVRCPWWRTWWACLIYLFVFLASTYLFLSLLYHRMQLRRSVAEERMEKERQKEIIDAKLQFFTNVVHEFSTPLTLIYGPCERLEEMHSTDAPDSKEKKYLHTIHSNAERMRRLIKELMDFQKVGNGYRPLRISEVDISEIIKGLSTDYSDYIDEHQLTFEIRTGGKPMDPDVPIQWVTDKGCIEKIICNLVSNAFKYVDEHGKVTIDIDHDDHDLSVRVRNTGKGFDSDQISKLFDRFYILENYGSQNRDITRYGVGLSMTKSLVELLGGQISVCSEADSYVEFNISVPQKEIPQLDSDPTQDTPISVHPVDYHEVITDQELSNPLIMVVDDNKDILHLLEDVLSGPYRVVCATDGRQALEIIRLKRPSLVITDIIMPGMDGMELLEELKNNTFTCHIPVIFLSSRLDYESQTEAYRRGLDMFITKPFNPKHLQAVVDRIISEQKQTAERNDFSSVVIEEYYRDIKDEDDLKFIINVTKVIEANLETENFTPEALSSELAMSYIQFYRKIKEILDMTPSSFIKKVKLKRAAYMLRHDNLSVQEVIFASGFNNRSYFYREFQKEFGVSPKNYAEGSR